MKIEYRFARASNEDKVPSAPAETHASDTWWSVCKAGSDNIRATFHDGVLVAVELIKDIK